MCAAGPFGHGAAMTRYEFAFAPAYRAAALPFGIMPRTTWVELDDQHLEVRYGPWRLRTPVSNLTGAQRTGGFAFLKTAGPPHLSFSDRGVSFTTNGSDAVCLSFREPVAGIDFTGRIKHPGATLSVANPDAFLAQVRPLLPA